MIDFLNEVWAWFQETAEPAKSVNLDVFTKQKNLVRGWSYMLDSLNNSEKKRMLIMNKEIKKYEDVHVSFAVYCVKRILLASHEIRR